MTEDQNIEDQDIELLDDEDENIEEAMDGGMKKKKMPEAMGHDPKNAEAQSVASVDAAGDATGGAPKRKMAGGTAADASNAEPMPKLTKMGMINAMYKMSKKMDKKKLSASYGAMIKMMKSLFSIITKSIFPQTSMLFANQKQHYLKSSSKKWRQSLKQQLSLSLQKRLIDLRKNTTKSYQKQLKKLKLILLKRSIHILTT